MDSCTRLNTHSQTRNLKGSADILPCPSPGKGPCIWVISEAKGKKQSRRSAAQENVILAASTQLNQVYKYRSKAGSGRVEKAQWKTIQSISLAA